MKLNDVRRFSAYVSTIYHSEYITFRLAQFQKLWLTGYKNMTGLTPLMHSIDSGG